MNKPRPVHASMSQFPVVDNQIQVGGMSITQLANRVGKTPFYAYDRQVIQAQIDNFRRHIPESIHLHYAIKANPMPALVNFLRQGVDGFDLASAGEMQVALDSGMPAAMISFAGPGKRHEELASAIAAGVTINLESEAELQRALLAAEQVGQRAKLALRVNPDFELKASGMKMGGGPKPFGIDAEEVPRVLQQMKGLDIDFMGFHIFSGSQNLSAESIIEAHNKTFDLALRLGEHAPGEVLKLNIGGGFGIPYFPGEKRLDLRPIGDNLAALLPDVRRQLPNTRIIIELGRYLVGEAGVYVSRVIERKRSRGHTFLITDGGLHHHLAASGNFGQVIRKNYPVVVANRVSTPALEECSVVGPLCTPLDILADKMNLAEAEAGDLILVYQSGAYGLSASPLNFLSHPAPAEVLV